MQGYIAFPNISPELFSISIGGMTFALRWYALAYIAGLMIGWRLILHAIATPRLWSGSAPMTAEQVERLLTWVIMGVILGGRLGFVLFYQPGYYLSHPQDILKVWQGGMSFHGGFLGVAAAAYMFFRAEKIQLLPAADLLALAAPVGLLLGRLANFINAELWGRQTDMPWGVAFPGDAAQYCPDVIGVCARHPSQLYEAALEGLFLGAAILWLVYRRNWLHRSGQVTGLFLAGYGAARFVVEFFRQPDVQFVSEGNPLGLAFQSGGYGLTMGQALSLPMIIVGLALIWRAQRAKD
jgi:phosphatidylglycerol---prolipoprotein diacylglyceryl transferase